MKKSHKILIAIVGIVLFCVPLALVFAVSLVEQQQYQQIETYNFSVEYAYGEVVKPERRDMTEHMSVEGTYVGYKDEFISLEGYSSLRFNAAVGEEVNSGEAVAHTEGGEEILSPVNGIIQEINTEEKYIRLLSLDDVALECYVSKDNASLLKQLDGVLYDEYGNTVSVLFQSNQVQADGTVLVRLKTGITGDVGTTGTFKLYTGAVYNNVLVVYNGCLAKNSLGVWTVRQVKENGEVIGVVSVSIGYNDGAYTMITTGLDENVYLDSGYSSYAG